MNLKRSAEAVRKAGAKGSPDTVLAHITPEEAALLKVRGGSGRKDKRTGLLHFEDNGDDGSGGGSSSESSSGDSDSSSESTSDDSGPSNSESSTSNDGAQSGMDGSWSDSPSGGNESLSDSLGVSDTGQQGPDGGGHGEQDTAVSDTFGQASNSQGQAVTGYGDGEGYGLGYSTAWDGQIGAWDSFTNSVKDAWDASKGTLNDIGRGLATAAGATLGSALGPVGTVAVGAAARAGYDALGNWVNSPSTPGTQTSAEDQAANGWTGGSDSSAEAGAPSNTDGSAAEVVAPVKSANTLAVSVGSSSQFGGQRNRPSGLLGLSTPTAVTAPKVPAFTGGYRTNPSTPASQSGLLAQQPATVAMPEMPQWETNESGAPIGDLSNAYGL